MTDREIIKTELGRLKTKLIEEGENTMFEQGRISAFEDMEVFIDSLQEEPLFHCGNCIKWKDRKGCTLEAENTHCITDVACSEGIKKANKKSLLM